MVRKHLYLFVLILGIVSAVSFASGQLACDPGSDTACGTPITEDGYGAVQLCENCFLCGLQDGVCPEDFASNETENIDYRMIVQMRTNTTNIGTEYVGNPVMYSSGNEACAVIGGTCQSIEELDETGWVSSSVTCSQSTPTGTYTAIRAVCENVPKTAGCYNCPDPDCQTSVRGMLYDDDNYEEVTNALVSFRATNPNSNVRFEAHTDTTGSYTINSAIRGYFKYRCLKVNYEPYEGQTLLIRGENIIDCPMRAAACEDDLVCSMYTIEDVPICRSICEGENDCQFEHEITVERYQQSSITINQSSLCDGRRADSILTIARHNETHVTQIQCCTGSPFYTERPQLQISGNVSDLITRDYVRILDDDQVTAKIIVYKTD